MTFAGTGINSFSGDGGAAVLAGVPLPACGSFDSSGNYYFGQDFSAPRIRKINTANIINTVAGNGNSGFAGDGGLATSAQIRASLFTVDKPGNIYIADYYNNRIRKVNVATGIINTIAGNGNPTHTGDGGPALQATLSPSDICIDLNGNIYVLDSARIRKIDVNGIITTVAGNGNGGFSGDGGQATLADITAGPGICTDGSGSIYFGCNGGTRIRKVDFTTNTITTIAGTGSYLYNGENLLATTAQFKEYGIAFDLNWHLYLADYGNQRIRMIGADGLIHTVVGTGTSGYNGDGGLADTSTIYSPEGIAFDTCGNLYIADESNNRIRKVSFNPSCYPEAVPTPPTSNISIYPNPTTTQLSISGAISKVQIINTVGQTVYTSTNTTTKTTIDISTLPTGIYFVKVNDSYVQKVVKE